MLQFASAHPPECTMRMPSARVTRSRARSPSMAEDDGIGTRSRGARASAPKIRGISPPRPRGARAPESPALSSRGSRMRAQDQTGPLGHDTMDESKDRRKGGIRQEHRWARRGTEDSTQPGPEAVVVPRESSKQSPGRSPQENTRSCNDIEGDGVHLAGQPATPFQRLLKSSTSLVSSAVKGVIGLMSPWEENGRSDGDGQMLVAQESFSSGEYDDVHSAERVDKAAHEAAPSMAAYEDGAVELPPPEDKAESDESYEGQPVDSITVSELKKILREKGLSYKGRKSELAER
ncbi:DNA-binding SAP [Nannochloropsis gaditana]|uniref:DNA-binding SAP n=1 Tax=Nannochloropsis gaditana TaxID=72520 RepID=W7TW26_9STRA|nr:DNA-binding SAP [Nannochloropsis gaditana]